MLRASRSGDFIQEIKALTSFRYFAALLVLLSHVMPIWLGPRYLSLPAPIKNCLDAGMVAVPFFFFLSGFVLAITYPTGAKGLPFLARRLARLAPLYFLSLALGLIAHRNEFSFSNLAAHLFFLSAWFPKTTSLNFPAWSLSAEIFFYALFPLLMPYLSRLRARTLLFACAFGYTALSVASVIFFSSHPELAAWPWHYPPPDPAFTAFLQLNPIVHLPEFMAGMALGLVFLQNPKKFAAWGNHFIILGLVTAFALLQMRLPFLALNSFLLLPCYALLIWGGAQTRALKSPALVLLGHASYGIYILHMPFRDLLTPWSDSLSPWWLTLAFLSGISLLCVFLYLRVESPIRLFFSKKFGSARPS